MLVEHAERQLEGQVELSPRPPGSPEQVLSTWIKVEGSNPGP